MTRECRVCDFPLVPAGDGTFICPRHPEVAHAEAILELLAENGGQMRQADMGPHLPVTQSAVAGKISRLANRQQVVRIPDGNETIVALPGDEPDPRSGLAEQVGELHEPQQDGGGRVMPSGEAGD